MHCRTDLLYQKYGKINRSHDSASGRPCALGGSRGTSLSYQPRSRTKSSLAGRCLHQLYQALKTGLVWTAFVWKKQYHLVALSSSVSGGKNYRWTEQNGADFANSFPRTPSGNLSNLYSLECISGARMFSQTGQWSLGFVPNICGYMSSTRYITAKYMPLRAPVNEGIIYYWVYLIFWSLIHVFAPVWSFVLNRNSMLVSVLNLRDSSEKSQRNVLIQFL